MPAAPGPAAPPYAALERGVAMGGNAGGLPQPLPPSSRTLYSWLGCDDPSGSAVENLRGARGQQGARTGNAILSRQHARPHGPAPAARAPLPTHSRRNLTNLSLTTLPASSPRMGSCGGAAGASADIVRRGEAGGGRSGAPMDAAATYSFADCACVPADSPPYGTHTHTRLHARVAGATHTSTHTHTPRCTNQDRLLTACNS